MRTRIRGCVLAAVPGKPGRLRAAIRPCGSLVANRIIA